MTNRRHPFPPSLSFIRLHKLFIKLEAYDISIMQKAQKMLHYVASLNLFANSGTP
jgi:hypothetical protein